MTPISTARGTRIPHWRIVVYLKIVAVVAFGLTLLACESVFAQVINEDLQIHPRSSR